MDDSPLLAVPPALRRAVPVVLAVLLGTAGLGYAIHEGRAAQDLALKNQRVTEELNVTNSQLRDLAAKLSAMTAQPPPASPAPQAQPSTPPPAARATPRPRRPRAASLPDRSYSRFQQQLDAQGRAIDQTRGDLADLASMLPAGATGGSDQIASPLPPPPAKRKLLPQ